MHRMPGQAFSPGARDSAVSAAPCVFLSPQRTARRGRLGGGDRWLEVYYREGKTGENWVKQGRGLSRRAPRPAPCFRAPDAFRAGGAAGNRTRNLRFRKPSLCPVELQPQMQKTHVLYTISVQNAIGHLPGGSPPGFFVPGGTCRRTARFRPVPDIIDTGESPEHI